MDPFHVICECGHAITGTRREKHQVVACSDCKASVFVSARSPWKKSAPVPADPAPSTPPGRNVWLLPAATVLLTALLVAGGGYWFLTSNKNSVEPVVDPNGKIDTQAELLKQGRQFLAEGKYHEARTALETLPTEGMTRDVASLKAHAVILSDLLAEPLEEVARHAVGIPGAEWEKEFTQRYLGKGLLLETSLRPMPEGKLTCDYQLMINAAKVRIDLSDLEMFKRLDPAPGTRVLLGLRLKSLRLEPPGPTWVLRFDSSDAVLLTEQGAVARVCPDWGEPAFKAVFDRQREWTMK